MGEGRRGTAVGPRLSVTKDDATGKVSVRLAAEEGRLQEAIDALLRSLGLGEGDAALVLIEQISNLVALDRDGAELFVNGILGLVRGIQPRDPMEAMLAVQMIALHNAMMDQVRRLAAVGAFGEEEIRTRLMVKLSKAFCSQVEALVRYRSSQQSPTSAAHDNSDRPARAVAGAVPNRGGRVKSRGQPHERMRLPKRPPVLS